MDPESIEEKKVEDVIDSNGNVNIPQHWKQFIEKDSESMLRE